MTRLGAFILIAFVAASCGGSSSNSAAPARRDAPVVERAVAWLRGI